MKSATSTQSTKQEDAEGDEEDEDGYGDEDYEDGEILPSQNKDNIKETKRLTLKKKIVTNEKTEKKRLIVKRKVVNNEKIIKEKKRLIVKRKVINNENSQIKKVDSNNEEEDEDELIFQDNISL